MATLTDALRSLSLNAAAAAAAIPATTPVSSLLGSIQHIACPSTQANELIADFVGQARLTPQNRPIVQSIQPIEGQGQKLSFLCTNPDRSQDIKSLPLAVSPKPADTCIKMLSLDDLQLPQELKRKVRANTAQRWLEQSFPSINLPREPVQAHVTTCCMVAPVSTQGDKAQVVGCFQSGSEKEHWAFLCYNRGGDCYGTSIVEFAPGACFQLQNGPLREGSDWSVYTLSKGAVDAIRRENAQLADEIINSSLVVIGIRLQPEKPVRLKQRFEEVQRVRQQMVEVTGRLAEQAQVEEQPVRRELHALYEELRSEPRTSFAFYCQTVSVAHNNIDLLEIAGDYVREECGEAQDAIPTPVAEYGVFGKGQERKIDHAPATYNGRYDIMPGHSFVCIAGAAPVDYHDMLSETNLTAYLDSLEARRDEIAAKLERLDPTRFTYAELRSLMIKNANIQTASAQPDLLFFDHVPCLDYTKSAKTREFLRKDMDYQSGTMIEEKKPTVVSYATSEKTEVLIYSYRYSGYVVHSYDAKTGEKRGGKRTLTLDEMSHERMI